MHKNAKNRRDGNPYGFIYIKFETVYKYRKKLYPTNLIITLLYQKYTGITIG